ncbi:Zn-dependent hydrolase [Cohnella herbarum]|nr:Zn-dependent hydrolase [Cohnella herbarum]
MMEQMLLTDSVRRERLLNEFQMDISNLLDWLATYTIEKQPGITRLLYSKEWFNAQKALEARMEERGLTPSFDEVGNLFGTIQGGHSDLPSILVGSHIDTVAQGGKYDGAYGIVAGLIAVDYLQRTYGQPKCTLEVVSLCEEEGSRFPIAYWGSGSIAGERNFQQIKSLRDREGILFVDAMHDCGFGECSAREAVRKDIGTFVELHIEQGGVLEEEGLSIGIVEAIAGQIRLKFEIIGEPNHAGTTPMYMRRDALEGASAMIRWLRDAAVQKGPPLVATVGSLDVSPNVSNVVPGQAIFTVDIRHSDEVALEQFRSEVITQFTSIAAQRGLGIQYVDWFNEKPVPMDENLNRQLVQICDEMDIKYRQMVSGAGHDAQMFKLVCPTALVFVPSQGGISHSPEEYSDARELAVGVLLLVQLLYKLGYAEVEKT